MKKILFSLSILIATFQLNLTAQNNIGTGDKNSFVIKSSNEKELIVSNRISEINYKVAGHNGGNYVELSVEGYSYTFKTGAPKLPVLRKLIELPVGAEPEINITYSDITEYRLKDLGFPYPVVPVQLPATKGKTTGSFLKDKVIYSTNAFYGDNLASVTRLGVMRGYNLGRLDIAPIQYNPVTQTIKVYKNLEITVTFKNADMEATHWLKRKNESPYFSAITSQIINNLPSPHYKDTLTRSPVKYVIVSDTMFRAALQPFIAWKTKKGFQVVEAYTNNPAVGNTTTSIKNYLAGLYNNATPSDPAPTFILLVGDVAQVPSFNGTTGTQVTDLYYAEYTGDFFPEVYYGRFSATNVSELQPQIDKTLEYEQYLMPDPTFLNNVVMVGGVDGNYGPIWANGQINYGTENYFNASNGLFSYTFLYPGSADSAAAIIDKVSTGVGYANYTAHGSSSGWANPSFGVNDVPGLKNAHKYPLMVGNCCLTNKFDETECFGEALLRANQKGALGYIGASNVSYWDEDYYWGVGVGTIVEHPTYAGTSLGAYDRTFHSHSEPTSEWYVTQDQMVFAGNLAVTQGSSNFNYYWEIYHLMGDPSLMVYFSVPPAMSASYPASIPLGLTSLTVNTEPYAYIGLSQNGILHGAGFADATGMAVLNIVPFVVPGPADIVITKQNKQPFIGSFIVQSPNSPYVLMKSKLVDDASGNNNGKPDCGELISLHMTLKNYGLADTGVTAVLRTSDNLITLVDSADAWGNINQNDTVYHTDAYSFRISNQIPDQHIARFTLHISDHNGTSWETPFTLVLNAPTFAIGSMEINDLATGNRNHRFDAGENVQVIIHTSNSGHAAAPGTIATLTTTNPYLTIMASPYNFNTFTEGTSGEAIYNVSVSPSAPQVSTVTLNYEVHSGLYGAQKTFNTIIGMISENWESGNMTRFPWQTSGDSLWYVTSFYPFEGAKCLRSGHITDNQKSELNISMDVLADDSISFYRRVSSEDNYDYLRFYVDNTKLSEWCGEKGWARVSFPVSTGMHTFKWAYEKDGSESRGEDASYLDLISFPPFRGMGINEATPNANLSLNVYPNPFNDKLIVDVFTDKNTNGIIALYNAVGEQVLSERNSGFIGLKHYEINTSGLPAGFYFCKLQTTNGSVTKKIVLAR